MTDTYFAADLTNSFITLSSLNLRNLGNDELVPFYTGPNIPPSSLSAGLSTAQNLISSAGLGSISPADYGDQTTGSSVSLFIKFLTSAGIEYTYVDDFSEASSAATVPDLGARSAYVTKKSGSINLPISDIRDRIRNETDASTSEHLVEPIIPVFADADPYAAVRIRNMREYITRYLKV